MSKDDTKPYSIDLEPAKVVFLQEMMSAHGLPDMGKAVRCLINYARENPDKQGDIFGEIRCMDC